MPHARLLQDQRPIIPSSAQPLAGQAVRIPVRVVHVVPEPPARTYATGQKARAPGPSARVDADRVTACTGSTGLQLSPRLVVAAEVPISIGSCTIGTYPMSHFDHFPKSELDRRARRRFAMHNARQRSPATSSS